MTTKEEDKCQRSVEIEAILRQHPEICWFHRLEAVPGSGVFTPGFAEATPEYYERLFSSLDIPVASMAGKRVIDIGTSSGALAFWLEAQGAEVLAIDLCVPEQNGFALLKQLRGSKVQFRQISVYDLSPLQVGMFDVVLCFGVYYHLKHPLLAWERINSIMNESGLLLGGGTTADRWFHDDTDGSCTRGVSLQGINREGIPDAAILSVDRLSDLPLCGFAAHEFLCDTSNWFIPTARCVEKWLESSGFALEKTIASSFPLKRAWETPGLHTSAVTFKACKSGPPLAENKTDPYHPIPTRLELEQARLRISQLEAELACVQGRS